GGAVMAAKIRKGDKVIVLTGRDKGRSGEVSRCAPRRAAPWCAASIWSSGTRSRARRRRAASSPRRPPCLCPISRSPIPRTASRRASASSSWARATIDARCGWPSVRELRSMADTETKPKAEKQPQKSDKAPRPEKGDKAQQAQKGPKPEKGDKAAKGE